MVGINEATILRKIDPVRSSEWAQLIKDAPSTVFHSPQWMNVIEKTYGLEFSALILESNGRPEAGVAWSEVDDLLGRRRISLPFSDLGDLLASDASRIPGLVEPLLKEGLTWSLRTLERNKPELGVPVKVRDDYKWHGIPLEGDTSVLWDRMSSMSQRGVRKAERSGVQVVTATAKDQLREWFLLHMRLRREKFSLLAQPYEFMENIWDNFIAKDQGFLLLAMHEGKMIAGVLYLVWKDTCFYKFNASSADSLELRPNNLLMWHGMLEAKERKAKMLDLGRSSSHQEGLVGYKRGFGATEETLLTLTYNVPVEEPKQIADIRRLFGELTKSFVAEEMPEKVTENAGRYLYRYFV